MSEIVEIIDGDVVVFEECNGDVVEFVANSIVVIIPELSAADLEQRLSELTADDVNADSAGSAAAVRGELEPQIAANAAGLASKADATATSQALAGKRTDI